MTPSEPQTPPFDRAALEAMADPFARLRAIMARLLDPDGCPWDREQTHTSLRQYFIEEVYEVCEAIDDGDDDGLCEELGDVALQIVFHAALAQRRGAFDVDDVLDRICTKLLDRHPHVFGDRDAANAAEVWRHWERTKKAEKARKARATGDPDHASAVAGVPRSLPGLQRAGRLQSKASQVGFDWDRPEDVADKVREEVEEFLEAAGRRDRPLDAAALRDEFGDLLFSLVNLSRFLNIQAEEAMEAACNRFIERFMGVERKAEAQGRALKEMTLAEMDALWEAVKREIRTEGG